MPRTPPRDWKRALAAVDDEHFGYRVEDCDSARHLKAAVAYEAENYGRQERIARLNQRLAEVRT